MGGQGFAVLAPLLVCGLVLTAAASAQERSAPGGAVTVRPVQVREVRVDQPAAPPLDERPSFGAGRPLDPGFISRPVPRTQPRLQTTRNDNGGLRRRPSGTRSRASAGHAQVIGYPVIYPYVSVYGDPFSPSPVSSAGTVPAPARNTYSNVESPSSGDTVLASSPRRDVVECEGAAPCGGLSFDVTPAIAQVSVDGVFVGVVDDFRAMTDPLLLAPGGHFIEIRLAGYRTVAFEAMVVSGDVTPYQGTLERLRLRRP